MGNIPTIQLSTHSPLAAADITQDNKMNGQDYRAVGMSREQAQGAAILAALMQRDEFPKVDDSFSLAGKNVLFADGLIITQAQARSECEAAGGHARQRFTPSVDVVVLPDFDESRKAMSVDAKAIRANTLGLAQVFRMRESEFRSVADRDAAPIVDVAGFSGPYVTMTQEKYSGTRGGYYDSHLQVSQALLDQVKTAIVHKSGRPSNTQDVDMGDTQWSQGKIEFYGRLPGSSKGVEVVVDVKTGSMTARKTY